MTQKKKKDIIGEGKLLDLRGWEAYAYASSVRGSRGRPLEGRGTEGMNVRQKRMTRVFYFCFYGGEREK